MSKWETIPVRNICLVGRGRVISQLELVDSGAYPVYSSQSFNNGEMGRINTYDFDGEYVTWTTDGAYAGTVFLRSGKFNCTNVCGTLKSYGEVNMQYLAYKLGTIAKDYVSYVGNPKLMNNIVAKIPVSYPVDIAEQRKIAEVLSTVDEAIEKTNAIIEKYAAIKRGLMQGLLSKGKGFSLSKLGKIVSGGTPSTSNAEFWDGENIWLTPADLSDLTTPHINSCERTISKSGVVKATGILLPANSVIISNRAPVGYCAVSIVPCSFNQGCKGLICNTDIDPLYIYYFMSMSTSKLERVSSGTTFLELPTKELKRFIVKVPEKTNGKPDLNKQKEVSNQIYSADEKIETERKYLAKLQNTKKGLMQDLLTNKVSVEILLKEESL